KNTVFFSNQKLTYIITKKFIPQGGRINLFTLQSETFNNHFFMYCFKTWGFLTNKATTLSIYNG
ncbi:hypothetical protein ABLU25_14515, partial [Acinetobacter nosocomialis]|uniref:hypothetical protein n=1 Tax=Acinetobacter nosocomialis TaxID=106654 RepID=UPI0032B48E1E